MSRSASFAGGNPRHVLGTLAARFLQRRYPLLQLPTDGSQFGLELLGALALCRDRGIEFLATTLCRLSGRVAFRTARGGIGQLRFQRVHARDEGRPFPTHAIQLALSFCQ